MTLGPFGYSEEILSAIPYGCLVVDRSGLVQAVNPAALRLLGVKSSDLIQRELFEAVPAWGASNFKQAFPALGAAQAEPVSSEKLFDLPGAGGRWLRVSVQFIFADPQQTDRARLLLVLSDATELVELKARLRRTEYQAAIGKLARGIAHELNNPLDGVLRYTHLALEQMQEETPVREHLVHVKEGLDRMVRATKVFLEFSRQVSTPMRRAADLNKLAEDALVLVRHRAKFQQVRIVTELDRNLPPIMDGGLQYALANLVRNAFDAMPRGGTLTLVTGHTASHVYVQVEDTGTGIPEEARRRMFDPFFTTKPSHKGSGLGLAIAKEAVERSGGRLEFESRVGVGTIFRIYLPILTEVTVPSAQRNGEGGQNGGA